MQMTDNPVFIDTNILVYANLALSPFHSQATERLQAMEEQEIELWISRQTLREYLARKQDLSLAEMLRRLEKKRLEERSLSQSADDMTAQQGVQAAFELSWQELDNTDKQLACLLSLFAPAPISWELIELCLPDVDVEELEESRDDKLINLHLLQRKEKGIYQLHPLLREFFQAKLTELDPPNPPYQGGQLDSPLFKGGQGGDLKQAFATAMIAVAKQIPQTPTREQITVISPVIPHLAEVAKNLIQYVTDEDLIWAFFGNASFYNDQAAPWYGDACS